MLLLPPCLPFGGCLLPPRLAFVGCLLHTIIPVIKEPSEPGPTRAVPRGSWAATWTDSESAWRGEGVLHFSRCQEVLCNHLLARLFSCDDARRRFCHGRAKLKRRPTAPASDPS
jgi:hypothetical protein